MADITVTFADGQPHTYSGVPDDVTPDQIEQRATKDFSGRKVTHLDRSNAPKTLVEQIPGQIAPSSQKKENRHTPIAHSIVGAVEAGLVSAGQLFGTAGGAIGGIAGSIATGEFGTKEGEQRVEDVTQEAMGKMPQPRTEKGKQYLENIGKATENIPALIPGEAEIGMVGQFAKPSVTQAVGKAGDIAGKAGEVVGNVAAKVIPSISEEKANLAKKGLVKGIPIPLHAITDNKLLKMAGEFVDNLPAGGGVKAKQKVAFHKGVIEQIGGDTSKTALTPQVFEDAVSTQGGIIGDIYSSTNVPMDSAFSKDIASVRDEHALPPGADREHLEHEIARLNDMAKEHNGVVPGAVMRRFNTKLNATIRNMSPERGDLKAALGDLKESISDAVTRSLPDDAARAALHDANMKYAKAMTIVPLVAKGDLSGFSPSALKGILTSTASGKRRVAMNAAGEMGDYANLAQEFMKEEKSSGTAERNFVIGAMTEAVATGGIGLGKTAAALALANLYNRISPVIARHIINRSSSVPKETVAAVSKMANDDGGIKLTRTGATISPQEFAAAFDFYKDKLAAQGIDKADHKNAISAVDILLNKEKKDAAKATPEHKGMERTSDVAHLGGTMISGERPGTAFQATPGNLAGRDAAIAAFEAKKAQDAENTASSIARAQREQEETARANELRSSELAAKEKARLAARNAPLPNAPVMVVEDIGAHSPAGVEGLANPIEKPTSTGERVAVGNSGRPFKYEKPTAEEITPPTKNKPNPLYDPMKHAQEIQREQTILEYERLKAESLANLERQWKDSQKSQGDRNAAASSAYDRKEKSDTAPMSNGKYNVDGFGFVMSDKGSPIWFKDQKMAGRWFLSMGKLSPTQVFELHNYPGKDGFTIRQTKVNEPPQRGSVPQGQGMVTQ
jgi:hypothetical protein